METDLVVAGYIFHENKVLLVKHKKLGLWLPVGGHIEENETPDDALLREVKEETGLDIEILNQSSIPLEGNAKRNLATPFYSNVHSVGDHDHSCFYYIARALNPEEIRINKELRDYGWFSRKGLDKDFVPIDVRNQALRAFEIFGELI